MKKSLFFLLSSFSLVFGFNLNEVESLGSLISNPNYVFLDTSNNHYGSSDSSYCISLDYFPGYAGCGFSSYSGTGSSGFAIGCQGADTANALSCEFPSSSSSSSSANGSCPVGTIFDSNATNLFKNYAPSSTIIICKKISCPVGFSWNGSGCVPLCPQNETYVNGSCQCFPNMTRGSNGVCSDCPSGTNKFPNGVCYGSCPSGTNETYSITTKAQLCIASSGNSNAFFIRKNSDGSIDVIKGDGAFIRYDKNGNPVIAYDNMGNPTSIPDGTPQYPNPNPRGTINNPFIAAGLITKGVLITSAGVLALPINPLVGAVGISLGAHLTLGGVGMLLSQIPPSSSGGTSGGGTSGGSIELNLDYVDISGLSPVSPTSTTQNANGSVTKTYKPNSDVTVTETKYENTTDYIVADSTGVSAITVNNSDLQDNGATTMQPQPMPNAENYVPDSANEVTTSNSTYIPNVSTGGYIPANPQSSGGGTSGGGVSDPAGGGTSSGGSTSGGSTSGGGTMDNGQTSGAAGTDGNSTSTGEGKDFGSEFGDFAAFKSWDEVLGALGGFKDTIAQSFENLKNSISSLKNTFQDGDGNSKINASLSAGSADACGFSFMAFGRSVDLKDGMHRAADIFRPFISLIVFLGLSYLSMVVVFKTIRGGAE